MTEISVGFTKFTSGSLEVNGLSSSTGRSITPSYYLRICTLQKINIRICPPRWYRLIIEILAIRPWIITPPTVTLKGLTLDRGR